MTKAIPNELKGVMDGDGQSLAPGTVRRASVRTFRSSFDTAEEDTTTSDTLSLGDDYREGDRVIGFIIASSTNMSAASLAIGDGTTADKFKAAGTLPNATTVFVPVKAATLDDDALTEPTELIGTISGATIPDGILVIETLVSHR